MNNVSTRVADYCIQSYPMSDDDAHTVPALRNIAAHSNALNAVGCSEPGPVNSQRLPIGEQDSESDGSSVAETETLCSSDDEECSESESSTSSLDSWIVHSSDEKEEDDTEKKVSSGTPANQVQLNAHAESTQANKRSRQSSFDNVCEERTHKKSAI